MNWISHKPPTLHKVTAFITRDTKVGRDLLVLEHPTAGLQLPAGTAAQNETPEAAVLREAYEESSLVDLRIRAHLASEPVSLAADQRYMLEDALLQTSPDESSTTVRSYIVRRGLLVRMSETEGNYAKVSAEEGAIRDGMWVITARRTGWVPLSTLTNALERHYFHVHTQSETPEQWDVQGEPNVLFRAFWKPLNAALGLVAPQNEWLQRFSPHLMR
jgi:8-oxo-dGTP pyrophosphatase MutT (NUDIX family)